MYEVDARGLSCPEPVLLTAAALENHRETQIKVLVNEAHTRDNVMKYAKSKGKNVTVTEKTPNMSL